MKAGSKTWLTPKRLRTHGLLLAVALWGLYVWTIATPGLRDRNGNLKGTDFLHLYALGSLAAEHRGADLYDINAQAALVAQRVPDAAGIRYLPLYPPQVSIFFAPLAGLSYGWALSVWWIFSAAIYGICCCSVWRACPKLRDHGGTVPLLAAASPAFFNLIAWGQTSAVALACFTLMYFLLRDRREFIAGVALGCLIFKPQLGLAAAVVFAAIGAWKILAGAALSSAAQLSLGAIYYGTEPFRRWLGMLWNIRALLPWLEPKPYQTHCLRTFWAMIVPWPALSFALYGASAAIILIVTIRLWNRRPVSAARTAVFRAAVGDCAGGAASHGVRPGGSGSGDSDSLGLAGRATLDRRSSPGGHSALPGVRPALARDCRPLYACSAFRLGNGGSAVRDRSPGSERSTKPGHANGID